MTSFHEQYENQIKVLSNRMRGEAMPTLTEELFALFETEGNRLEYEAVYFKRRKFLAVFGLAAYLFRQPEDVAKLEEVLNQICEEECWALPAHVNRKEHTDWRHTVDLFAAETAQTLAEIVTLVGVEKEGMEQSEMLKKAYTVLASETVKKVCAEIEKRVLQPFEKNHQGWECSDHNWNAVCGGSIGSAAMYLLAGKEEERLEKLLQRICHSLQFYLDGFRADGACMEGIGYFTYGMTYFTGFAEQLLRYSKGKYNLFASDKVRKIAEFQQKVYFSNGQTVSFSDGEADAKFRMGLTVFLAERFDTVKIPNPEFACGFETDPCYRFMGLLRDHEWTKPSLQRMSKSDSLFYEKVKTGMAHHFCLPDAQWSICESENGVGFAIKGGDNAEPHNHNDVGAFLYQAGGEQLICDLGAGEYTADYFGTGRYQILCNSSKGHSVPVVKGSFQKAGKQYRAASFEADGCGTTKLEFAGAYGTESLKKLERTAEFSLQDGSLTVHDSFELQEQNESGVPAPAFTETLVTRGQVSLSGSEIMIQGENTACIVQLKEKFENLRVTEQIHADHEGKTERVCLIQWDVLPQNADLEKDHVLCGSSRYCISEV